MIPPLTNKLNILQKQMELKLAEIRESYSHPGNIGYNAEVVVRDFMRCYLPPYNRIGHGEVIDSFGNCSKQIDVVVTNEHHPYINDLSGPSVYLVEGVACVGEIKSVLTTEHLNSALDSCFVFKYLKMNLPPKTGVTAPPSNAERFVKCRPYFLFAFESQLSFENVFQRLRDKYVVGRVPIHQQIDCVVLLDKGAIVNLGDGEGALTARNQDGHKVMGYAPFGKDGEHGILLTYLFWLNVLILKLTMHAPILIPYIIPKE